MAKKSNSFPGLEKSYKGLYPFRLGTTSFIHPAGYADNAALVGPYVDEIELLFFESLGSEISPLKEEIRLLERISEEQKVSYNVHLPTDVWPGHESRSRRQTAVDELKRVIDLTAPLMPSTWTLHLPFKGNYHAEDEISPWQERIIQSLAELIDTGIHPHTLSIETLDYPFEVAEPIVIDLDLNMCLDIGHCIVHGFDYERLFSRLNDRVAILHLHGVERGRDHLSLDRLAPQHAAAILKILRQFNGVASLEIFSYDHLKTSLEFLGEKWH